MYEEKAVIGVLLVKVYVGRTMEAKRVLEERRTVENMIA